jgi:uncharacterized membrane protein YbhN (UPF0104 family)
MTKDAAKLGRDPSTPAGRAARSWVGFVVSIGLTVAILAWVWSRHSLAWSAVRDQVLRADLGLLALVFVGSAAFHVFFGAHKLHCILRAAGVDIRFAETLKIRLGAGPMRALLPLSAGELIQLFYFRANKQMQLTSASGIVVFDKGINLLGALSWFAVGLTFAPSGTVRLAGSVEARWLGLLPGVLIAACLVVIFLVPAHDLAVRIGSAAHPKLGGALANLLAPFRALPPTTKLALVSYGAFFQLRPIVVCFFLLRAVGLNPSLVDTLTAASAAVCAGYIPGFVSGSGPREAVLVEALRSSYAPVDAIFCAGLLMTFAVHLVPALLGAPWTFWFIKRLRSRAAEETAS